MNADEVQADQTGESQPVVCDECRKSQTNHYGPCPHWNDQKKINEQFAKCLPGMLQDMAEVIVDVERRPAAEVEQEYDLPPGSLTKTCKVCGKTKTIERFTVFRPNICGECAEKEVAEFLSEPPEQTFGPSQAEEIRQATKHAQQTPADGPTVENPWMKAERLEKELAAAMAKLHEDMENCTILCKNCPRGHSWLTATNWSQHGCPTCARQSVEKDRDSWKISAQRWVDHADGLQDELKVAKRTAADLKLLLAEAKSIEKIKEFSRDWRFVSNCTLIFIAVGVAVAIFFKR